ncbi:hypothetical protein GWK47_008329 [Chionoecetes opilio]|uniref:Uncharacterized protein n=1 Tax=Chionoecetes opilio TaxID=41210 RepID=A0A8J5C590_CHIOP|nr:hypothetical protein GWK47_008329 [Chionoecetes opilio]
MVTFSQVLWNEERVVKVVAKAYTKRLTELLHNTRNNSIDTTTWYTCLPDLSQTVCGFLKVKDVLTTNGLNTLEPGFAKTMRSVLCALSLPLAALPDHVHASLNILGHQMFPVTPQHLRNALKTRNSLNEEWSRSDLLYYATQDRNYQDLCGLPLLPLQDNSWTCFRATGAAVYLCSPGEVKGLVGLEGRVDGQGMWVFLGHSTVQKGFGFLRGSNSGHRERQSETLTTTLPPPQGDQYSPEDTAGGRYVWLVLYCGCCIYLVVFT